MPYQTDDQAFGEYMAKALSPLAAAGIDPEEARANPQAALAKVAAANGYAASPAASPVASSAPPATPASNPVPASVTTSGNPSSAKPSGWADYVRQSLSGQTGDLGRADTAIGADYGQTVAPLEQQLAKDSTPINPNQPQYKPSIGTRILRGVGAVRRGGILAAFDPESVGATPYGAPNGQYQKDVGQQQQRIASDNQQLSQAAANFKARLEQAKALQENATGYNKLGGTATAQQGAEAKNAAQDNVMIRNGLKKVTDDQGNTTWVEDPDSEAFKGRKILDDAREANIAFTQAKTAAANADPNTPAGRLAIMRAQTAAANASAAQERAQAYMGNYLQHSKNIDLQGNVLPGAPIISNEQGDQTVVGSTNANTAIKNQANMAQFKDVLGATDQLENTATRLVQKKGKDALSDPIIAAGLAEPKGTFSQWMQGQVANGSMTPEQRDYVTNLRAYRENLQALRKSAGGGVSDAQVNRLMQMAPGASTPDLDFLKRQTGQIRQTANRLGQGTTQAAGGLSLHEGGKSGKGGEMPPQSVVDSMKEGQYVHGPGGTYQKKGGKLVEVGK